MQVRSHSPLEIEKEQQHTTYMKEDLASETI